MLKKIYLAIFISAFASFTQAQDQSHHEIIFTKGNSSLTFDVVKERDLNGVITLKKVQMSFNQSREKINLTLTDFDDIANYFRINRNLGWAGRVLGCAVGASGGLLAAAGGQVYTIPLGCIAGFGVVTGMQAVRDNSSYAYRSDIQDLQSLVEEGSCEQSGDFCSGTTYEEHDFGELGITHDTVNTPYKLYEALKRAQEIRSSGDSQFWQRMKVSWSNLWFIELLNN